MNATFYLVKETVNARQYSRTPDGMNPFWVPRSVCVRTTKWKEPGKPERHEVDIENWFANKEGLE